MFENNFRLDDRVAVVTGASSNIGLEVARAFALSGASVIMVARGGSRLQEAAESIRNAIDTGGRIDTVVADAASAAGAEKISACARERFRHIDILVNNAYAFGDTLNKPILDIPDDDWIDTFHGNVLGPFRLCRELGRLMMQGGGGSIINLLSGAAFQPTKSLAPYGCSKAALWAMTRYLSQELAPKIRVNAICPGIIGRDMPDVSNIPMGRVGSAVEVAPAAVYLSSEAASYVTGTVVFVNGGKAW